VHTLDPSVGGVAAAVLALSRGLARRGHKLDVVVLDEPDVVAAVADRGPEVNITVHALGSGLTSYRYSCTLWPWLRCLAALRRLIDSLLRFSPRHARSLV